VLWVLRVTSVALLLGLLGPAAAHAACPVAPDAAALPSAAALARDNGFVGRLGARPTGSPAHNAYISWIRRRLKAIPGVQVSEIGFPIKRWVGTKTVLTIKAGRRTVTLPVAGAIPYAKATSKAGTSAPVAVVPEDQAISAANAKGRIVVRHAPAGSIAQFLFLAVSWGIYDPQNTIDLQKNFYGDFINYNARVTDLRNAAVAGAKGIVFVKDQPRRQLAGHYEPYEGAGWGVPGAFLGVDEGKRITDSAAAGPVRARLIVRASYKRATTPTILATIPGASPQRIVIDSHTDGTNAVEDNGPVAMVGMARYFARLPAECRPRTIQFAFSTAHFYQRLADPAVRDGGAGQLAQRLDREYDEGKVSSVLVLEHLGAKEYATVPRAGGKPGGELKATGRRAIQFVGITPSPPLVAAVDGVVRGYDMQRTIELQGSDAPGTNTPAHCSFGGEGTPYNNHLLPTVGVIAAPESLYDPAFGVKGIDFKVMRSETLGFTELVNRLGTMSQLEVAGTLPVDRQRRAAGLTTNCPQAN
jgi:hypothetical protein